MPRVVNETLIGEIDEVETDGTEEFTCVDVLVCGVCRTGFHFVEEFKKHKLRGCKKVSAYQNQITKAKKKKPEFLGFLLWKNSIAKYKKTWKMLRLWYMLPENVRGSWIQAAKILDSYDELAKRMPDKVMITKVCSPNNLDEQPPESLRFGHLLYWSLNKTKF